MAGIKKLLAGGGGVLANYDYSDIAAGTGVVVFYGGQTGKLAEQTSYALATKEFYSIKVITDALCTSSAYVKYIDCDFDVKLNLPRIINGNVLVNIPYAEQGLASATYDMYTAAHIRKWDGTTETELGYVSGGIITGTAADNVFDYYTGAILIPVSSVHFKKDETIRLTVELWGRQTVAPNNSQMFIGHDPKNRATTGSDTIPSGNNRLTFGTEPSILAVQIPFKMDI